MPILHLTILAIIQGITEFLPISSSAHLIFLPNLIGSQDQGSFIDVAVHLGTLCAVVTYFRRDVGCIYIGCIGLSKGKIETKDEFFALCLVVATIPAVLAGSVIQMTGFDMVLRDNIALIGAAMMGFGIVLWWSDRKGHSNKSGHDWTLKEALIMGLYQTIALIPGTSRSGITISGARFMGYKREEAVRLSMLMSIPVIIAAATLGAIDAASSANFALLRDGVIAACFAAISAFIALALMMRLLRHVSFTPYVIYRIIFGAFLILWAYN
ncbi:MAG: undecaprenyl-diphosphate phosphatase [Aestuariivita sp.]|nr:undecaprenyl-diphosphate phosphatase [Aestuariivita sp.]|tara:strand:- start:135 stop:941 length:807 start_codon:yes stop_codon:yes gene_type:complete